MDFWSIITNPYAGPIAGAVVAFGVTYLLNAFPQVKKDLNYLDDYLEAVEAAVAGAEATGFTGARKLAAALNHMDRWLKEQGIEGNAKAVTMDRVRADIELARAKFFGSEAAR